MAVQSVSNERPTAFEVAKEYIQSPSGLKELVVEPATLSLRWAELAVNALSEIVEGPKKIFEQTSHLLLWAEYPTQLKKLFKSIVQLSDSLSGTSLMAVSDKTAKVYINTTFSGGLIAEGLEILHQEKLITLTALQFSVVQTVVFLGSIALFLNAARGAIKQFNKLLDSELGSPQFTLALLTLIAKVCLAVVAIFSMAAFFEFTIASTAVILAFSTALILFKLISYFYKKTHFPEVDKSSPVPSPSIAKS